MSLYGFQSRSPTKSLDPLTEWRLNEGKNQVKIEQEGSEQGLIRIERSGFYISYRSGFYIFQLKISKDLYNL